jgi:hypothetical protein
VIPNDTRNPTRTQSRQPKWFSSIERLNPRPTPTFPFPAGAVPADLLQRVPLQIVAPIPEPPDGEGWPHEIKHDGHRLLATISGDGLKLVSRNGHDRAALFREPFDKLATAGLPALVLDGEIAVPDKRGVTLIHARTQAMRQCRPERLVVVDHVTGILGARR